MDPSLNQESEKIVQTVKDSQVIVQQEEINPVNNKQFKVMSINEFKTTEKEGALLILHKKNMKFPTSIKLQAHFTNKSFEIYRAKQSGNSMISVQFGDGLNFQIIRHSNTQVKILDTKSE